MATASAPDPVPTSTTRAGRSPTRPTAARTRRSLAGRGFIMTPGRVPKLRPEKGISPTKGVCDRRAVVLTGEEPRSAQDGAPWYVVRLAEATSELLHDARGELVVHLPRLDVDRLVRAHVVVPVALVPGDDLGRRQVVVPIASLLHLAASPRAWAFGVQKGPDL